MNVGTKEKVVAKKAALSFLDNEAIEAKISCSIDDGEEESKLKRVVKRTRQAIHRLQIWMQQNWLGTHLMGDQIKTMKPFGPSS